MDGVFRVLTVLVGRVLHGACMGSGSRMSGGWFYFCRGQEEGEGGGGGGGRLGEFFGRDGWMILL